MTRRIAILGLWHETNTYSPIRTDLAAFEAFELLSGVEIVTRHTDVRSVIGGFLAADGLEAVPVFSAGAWPSGTVTADALRYLLDRIEHGLAAVMPVDGVLLNLHGATVAEGCPDVEAEVLRTIRRVLGQAPVAAVLDLHANPSVEFARLCEIVVSYDTYPHVDMYERGEEAAQLLTEHLAGRALTTVAAKSAVLSCPLAQGTDAQPMNGLQQRARDRAAAVGLRRICVTAGFPYSDVDRAGASVLAIADVDRLAEARRVVNETVADIDAHAADFLVQRVDPRTAVHQALGSAKRPVVIADIADNIGGGSPGDGTALLAELLGQGADNAVVVIADAQVARQAATAGVGADLDVLVGGKSDDLHGAPVRMSVRVERISDGRYTTAGSWMTGQSFEMGTTAVLRSDGVQVVVTERATPPFHREQLTCVGIDPAQVGVIVAKGAIAWRAAYPDAAVVIEAATPGVCPTDLTVLPRATRPRTVLA